MFVSNFMERDSSKRPWKGSLLSLLAARLESPKVKSVLEVSSSRKGLSAPRSAASCPTFTCEAAPGNSAQPMRSAFSPDCRTAVPRATAQVSLPPSLPAAPARSALLPGPLSRVVPIFVKSLWSQEGNVVQQPQETKTAPRDLAARPHFSDPGRCPSRSALPALGGSRASAALNQPCAKATCSERHALNPFLCKPPQCPTWMPPLLSTWDRRKRHTGTRKPWLMRMCGSPLPNSSLF